MKSSEKQRQSDYLLLYTILEKYLEKGLGDPSVAPRFLELDKVSEIVAPFYEVKPLIQRVEWLKGEEHLDGLADFFAGSGMSEEELRWAVEMFAVQKRDVLEKIEKRLHTYG